MIRCIHITPELPPAVGGVADYSVILSRRLVEVSDGQVEPGLIHAGRRTTDSIDVEFPVTDLSGQCSATALSDTIERLASGVDGQVVVLLEYSGYGYARRGAPWWLVRGLHQVRRRARLLLITMFHELYATAPPWTRAFWTSFPQAYVARRLAALSDGIVTNRRSSAEWLRDACDAGTPVAMQPVFSNVGEPTDVPPLGPRKKQAVVFGGQQLKRTVYRDRADVVQRQLRRLGMEDIIDIGPSATEPEQENMDIPVTKKGVLPSDAVSHYLAESQVGIAHCPSDCLTKSGAVAAYMAHGTVPLVIGDGIEPPLQKNRHFLEMNDSSDRLDPEMSEEGRNWYRHHAHSRLAARRVLSMMKEQLEHAGTPS